MFDIALQTKALSGEVIEEGCKNSIDVHETQSYACFIQYASKLYSISSLKHLIAYKNSSKRSYQWFIEKRCIHKLHLTLALRQLTVVKLFPSKFPSNS